MAMASLPANFNVPPLPKPMPFIDHTVPEPFDLPFFEFPSRRNVVPISGGSDADDDDDDEVDGEAGTGGGSGSGAVDEQTDDTVIDPPDDDDQAGIGSDPLPERNRAPRNSGPVYLADVGAAAILMIGLGDLLANTDDPDGDALQIRSVTASAGQLTPTDEGWQFLAPQDLRGPVEIAFEITDGTVSVAQVAHLNVVADGTSCVPIAPDADGCDTSDAAEFPEPTGEIAAIHGTAEADHIVAGVGDDIIFGGGGNDVIFGGAGADQISGGAGNDRLVGEAGDDTLFGDDGDDDLSGGSGNDILWGGRGNDAGDGGTGDDVLSGGTGRDRLAGGYGHDVLLGGSDDDTLTGDGGNDTLDGGDGDDVMAGGTGDDRIFDGAGSDIVDGGSGNDRVVAAPDRCDDTFQGGRGTDVLDYSADTQGVTVDLVAAVVIGDETGVDAIGGFEIYQGGAGDDTFIAGGEEVSFAGGGGKDCFDFSNVSSALIPIESVYQILDFEAGDRVRFSQYDFFKDLKDEIEDQFDDYRDRSFDGGCDDDPKIRLRHEASDNLHRTLIEIDADRDDFYETTISLVGNHLLVVVDHG